MPQLHCYVPEKTMEQLTQKAKQSHLSTSKYLALLIQKDTDTKWPDNFFNLYGSWQGDELDEHQVNLQREAQGDYEKREEFL